MLLQRKNRELQDVLNASIAGMAIFDNGKCVDVNTVCLTQSYYTKEEIIGKSFFDFVDESEYEYLAKMLQSSQDSYELKLKRKDGSIFYGLMKGTDINKKRRISSFIDISNLKKVQNDLEKLTKTLENRVEEEIKKNREQELIMMQQSRLAQMGQTISIIAHQWKQPLNNLSLVNQAMEIQYINGQLDDKTMDKFHEESQKLISEMSDTINNFSNFFRPNKQKELFDMGKMIKDTVKLLRPILELKDIEVEMEFGKEISFMGHKNELAQAVINIINNAKDALVENNSNNPKKILIKLRNKKSIFKLTIEDNAGGIPTDIKDKIFDPYFSTKEKKSGTGLGLYISKVIVEKYSGGQLKVYNSNLGAIFEIEVSR